MIHWKDCRKPADKDNNNNNLDDDKFICSWCVEHIVTNLQCILPKMVSPNLCCIIWGHSVGWRAICKWIQASIPQHRSEQELSKNWTRTEQAHIAERTNNFLSDCSLLFVFVFWLPSPHPGRWFHCQRNSSPPCRSSLCTGSRFEPEQSNIDQHFKLFQKTPVYKRRSSLRGAATFTKVHSRLWGKEGKWSLLI